MLAKFLEDERFSCFFKSGMMTPPPLGEDIPPVPPPGAPLLPPAF